MSRKTRRSNKQPKLKNNQILQQKLEFVATTGDFISTLSIIENPTNAPPNNGVTGYVETIGRFSLDCTLEGADSLDNVALFVMYVPEGYFLASGDISDNPSLDVISKHPEWIMAYKYLGSPTDSSTGQGCQPTRIRSRVRRNLMTGDRIVLVVTGTNSAGQSITGTIWAYLKFASRIN